MQNLRNFISKFASSIPKPPAGGANIPSGGGSALTALVGLGLTGYGVYHSMITIQPGHKGVVYNRLGGLAEKAELKEGLNFVIPWFQRAVIYDIRTRPQPIDTQSGSKDLQMVQISLRVLFKPDPDELPFIYRRLGKDYDARVLPSIVNEVTKAVVAQYNASELLTKRDLVSKQIREMLTKRSGDFHILLDDVAITHLAFSKEYTAAVEAKQVAQQEAERAKYVVDRAYQEKKSIVIRAEGEAQSAQLIGNAIQKNPAFIQLRRIDAAKEIASMVVQSGNKVYLNADSLMINTLGEEQIQKRVMSDLSDPNRLLVVLNMLSANDTNTVKKGEKLLKPFLKNSTCILHLLNMIRNSKEISIRHHSSLLLKKKLGGFFPKFNAQQQAELKQQMLTIMISEPNKAVATALAGAVAIIAKAIFVKNGQWPELFNALMQLSHDPNEALRVLNYSLLAQLAEHVAIHLKPHTQTLAQMFVLGCQDPVSAVAVAALSATAAYIMEIGNEEEIMHLKAVINPMLQVMHNCLQRGDDETVTEGLDVIQECCNLEQPLVNDHIEVIVQFVVGIIQNKEYETPIKQSAGQTLMNIVECRPKLVAKKNLVGPTLAVLMEMIAKEDSSAAGSLFSFSAPEGILDDEDKDDDYSPEFDVQKLAQTIIDVMAMHIPSKYFVDPALTLCAQGMMSADPNMRKAGCAVLGVISEGCSDRIRENLSEILPRLLAAVQDPEFYVRECACFALGQFSEHCQPDILHYNQMVLPVIFQALDDPRPTVQSTSCYVLEYFCEGLQRETLRPYLNPLMARLANLLQSESKVTKEMALTAIAATAVASEIDFLPYSETICNILGSLLFNTDAAGFSLRGRSLECLGHIAVAIEEQHFARYFQDGMRSAIQGLQLNDESLKEHCFVFIANCAKVMSKSFDPYLPELVPYLLEVVAESELTLFEGEGDNDDEDNDGDENAEGEEGDSVGDNVRLNVEEGFINSKKAALTALGALAEHTKHSFYPYLQRTLNVLLAENIGAIYSLHDLVRAEALSILQYMLKSACEGNGIVNAPKFGEVFVLPDAVNEIGKAVMELYISSLVEDQEKLPVSHACEGLLGVLRLLGLAGLQLRGASNNSLAEEMMKAIHLLLSEKAPCQIASKREQGEDEDDDHDNLVIDAVTDLIGELAKIMKQNFISYFDEFQKQLLRFTKPARTHSDRSMAIGCYAEVVAELGPAAVKYADFLLPVIKLGLQDAMEGVRRNSAFCIGVLVESTGSALSSQFLNFLQWLHPLCIRHDSKKTTDVGGADVDNALSAVARMIRAAPTLIPLAQVLPVVLSALPLRDDTSEGPNVYGCLANLLLTNDATAVSMVQAILTVMGNTLSKESHDEDETKAIAVSCMKQMLSQPQHQAAVSAYLGSIADAELRQTVQQAVCN